MKKVLLTAAILIAGFAGVKAQTSFGGGVNLNLPIGDFSDFSSFGVGAELQVEHKFSEKFSGIGTTGFTHFIGKDFGGEKFNIGVLPILVGARVYPSEKFFIGAQIGYSLFLEDAEEGGFAYKPQVGYDAGQFQLSLSYNGISHDGVNTSYIGLGGIFKFGGSK